MAEIPQDADAEVRAHYEKIADDHLARARKRGYVEPGTVVSPLGLGSHLKIGGKTLRASRVEVMASPESNNAFALFDPLSPEEQRRVVDGSIKYLFPEKK